MFAGLCGIFLQEIKVLGLILGVRSRTLNLCWGLQGLG